MSAYLRDFPESELIFDEEETRAILKFIFPDDGAAIDNATITNDLRNFAQGILVEAVDATYAMGYVDALFQTIVSFLMSRKLSKGAVDFMKTFAKKAMKHWFKHATQTDLMHAKIYETVRLGLNRNFRTPLHSKLQGLAKAKGRSTYVAFKPQSYDKCNHEIAWS